MTVLDRLIQTELAEIGVTENPKGSNIVKYNDWYWGPLENHPDLPWSDLPWCCCFQYWSTVMAGFPYFPQTCSCYAVRTYAQSGEDGAQWVTDNYLVGDFFILPGDSHIGLIVEYNEKSNTFISVEGNYGDKVSKVTRKASEFAGAYRPDYSDHNDYAPGDPRYEGDENNGSDGTSNPLVDASVDYCDVTVTLPVLKFGAAGERVETMQHLLSQAGFEPGNSLKKNGRYDGEFGSGTMKALVAFQYEYGIDEGDVCGEKTWKALISEGEQ